MLKLNPGLKQGYNSITKLDDMDWTDPNNPLMNFGILRMQSGDTFSLTHKLEKVILIMQGNIQLRWEKNSSMIHRKSIFNENPTALLVPSSVPVRIDSLDSFSELCIVETINSIQFPSRLFSTKDCLVEQFGKGTLRETSTRDVRTVFDKNNMPESNLVLGEVINYPGKWSSYPPHGHNQPEIYHYRFFPQQGFGFAMDGIDKAHIVHNGDTLLILNRAPHSQTAAPGYAMYYIWAIRHLDGDPYGPKDPRKFLPEHTWVMDPKNNAKIWPPEK